MTTKPNVSQTRAGCDDLANSKRKQPEVDPIRERILYGAAFVFGSMMAASLEFTKVGRHIDDRQTWISAVAGVWGCLLIWRPLTDKETYDRLFNIFALASIALILRAVHNEIQLYERIKRFASQNSEQAEVDA